MRFADKKERFWKRNKESFFGKVDPNKLSKVYFGLFMFFVVFVIIYLGRYYLSQ